MSISVALGCLFIILARLTDVSLGTIRTICIVQGRATLSWIFGFFEVLVWFYAVSHAIQNLDSPIFALSYAFGFATGNYLGVHLEQRLAFGRQVVRIFTRRAAEVVPVLRSNGIRVTEFNGQGREGPVNLLFIETKRRSARQIVERAVQIDPNCFFIIDDVRDLSHPLGWKQRSTGWSAIFKTK